MLYWVAIREMRVWRTKFVNETDKSVFIDEFDDKLMTNEDNSQVLPDENGLVAVHPA